MKDYIKSVTNEQLATILRLIKSTGVCVSSYEAEYLEEAARRLEEIVLRIDYKNDGYIEYTRKGNVIFGVKKEEEE